MRAEACTVRLAGPAALPLPWGGQGLRLHLPWALHPLGGRMVTGGYEQGQPPTCLLITERSDGRSRRLSHAHQQVDMHGCQGRTGKGAAGDREPGMSQNKR